MVESVFSALFLTTLFGLSLAIVAGIGILFWPTRELTSETGVSEERVATHA